MVEKADTEQLIQETLWMMRVVTNIEEDEESGCWLWTGATTKQGHPIINLKQPVYGVRGCTTVRRFVRLLTARKLVKRQPIGCTCGNRLCVNPKHLRASSFAEIGEKVSKTKRSRGVETKIKIAKTSRANAKLNWAAVEDIRSSMESAAKLAKKYGVNQSLVTKVRRGECWKNYSNPWAGLGALT